MAIAAIFLALSVVGSHAASYDSEPTTLGANVNDEVKSLFSEWMSAFEKKYDTVEELEYRQQVWADNHIKILKHNLSNEKKFTMKVRLLWRYTTHPPTIYEGVSNTAPVRTHI